MGSEKKKVTLQDIADATGIAKSTVSMVMNGSWKKVGISEKRVEAVQLAAVRLGYRVNYAAQCVSKGTYNSIAMVFGTRQYTSSMHNATVGGAMKALHNAEYQLSMTLADDDLLTDATYMPNFLEKHMCDGLLMNYHAGVPARLSELIDRFQLPSIWLNFKAGKDCVHPDDYKAGFDVTHHLLELGHSRVAYVDNSYMSSASQGTRHYSKEDRMSGFRDAMISSGLQPEVLTDRPGEKGAFFKGLREMLGSADRPTALVAYSQELLLMAKQIATEEGLVVPDDLSMAGFGGHCDPIVMFHGFTLATIPASEIGSEGARMILEKIRDPNRILEPFALPFGLHPAGSTAKPPQS